MQDRSFGAGSLCDVKDLNVHLCRVARLTSHTPDNGSAGRRCGVPRREKHWAFSGRADDAPWQSRVRISVTFGRETPHAQARCNSTSSLSHGRRIDEHVSQVISLFMFHFYPLATKGAQKQTIDSVQSAHSGWLVRCRVQWERTAPTHDRLRCRTISAGSVSRPCFAVLTVLVL